MTKAADVKNGRLKKYGGRGSLTIFQAKESVNKSSKLKKASNPKLIPYLILQMENKTMSKQMKAHERTIWYDIHKTKNL